MNPVKTSMASLFEQLLDPANRPNPYPLYEQMRETPVAPLDENYYIVSTYNEILALLHNPSVSKEQRKSRIPVDGLRTLAKQWILLLDPPEHDRLRKLIMHQFTAERITGMQGRIAETMTEQLNA